MGKGYAGILGEFSGKIGNVVGQISRGQQVIKVYQPKVNNPKSEKQTFQREMFATAVKNIQAICKDDLRILDKKLSNGKTMYGEILGSAVSMLRSIRLQQPLKEKILLDSSLGDMGVNFKIYNSAMGDGISNIGFGIEENPGENFIGIPDIYTAEQIADGVTITFNVLAVNKEGEVQLFKPESPATGVVTLNPDYIPGAERPCGVVQSVNELTGFKYYQKWIDLMFEDVANVNNGSAPVVVWASDNVGNIFSVKLLYVAVEI